MEAVGASPAVREAAQELTDESHTKFVRVLGEDLVLLQD